MSSISVLVSRLATYASGCGVRAGLNGWLSSSSLDDESSVRLDRGDNLQPRARYDGSFPIDASIKPR